MDKRYVKADIPQEAIDDLFFEITGKRDLSKNEKYTLDTFFARDENGQISIYYCDSFLRQENIVKDGN